MIVWSQVANRLAALARTSAPGHVLSVTVALSGPLPATEPTASAWFRWRRPGAGLSLTGLGWAVEIESAGPGRFAALGAAMEGLRANWRRDDTGGPAPLAFGGFAFDVDGGAPLPNAWLAIPSVLLREERDAAWVTFSCDAAAAADALRQWRGLWESLADAAGATAPARLSRRAAPLEDQAFIARGQAALAAIRRAEVEKLVLTRRVRYTAARQPAPGAIFDALAADNPDCAVWACAREDRVFLGASPELLLEVRGAAVAVDALAGTAWLANTDAPASLPIGGDKNRREHDLVADAVAAVLAPLCEDVQVPAAPAILRVQTLQHLQRRIRARRRAGIGTCDLLASLHPTPAVGGVPTAAALAWLAAHGDRREAWYSGGVGWLAADGDADFAVALRCGLIAGRDVTLYAGSGFVSGSDAQQEFAETEAKLAPMLRAFGAANVSELGRAEGAQVRSA